MPDVLTAQGSYGEHHIHADFYGSLAPLGTSGVGTEVVTTYTTDETDGILARETGTSTGDTAVVGSGAVFSPATNGPLALEARVKMPVITNQAAWVGFSTQSGGADEVQDAGTLDASTVDAAGLAFDTGIDANQWNEYIATGSAETRQNLVGEIITADRWQVLRVEVDPDGTVRTYIADTFGKSGFGTGALRLIASRTAAISPTALLFAEVYSGANTTAAAIVEVDYYHLTAGRDWAVA